MKETYTATIKQSGPWWIGWNKEISGINCQEKSKEELFETLKLTLQEALEFIRRKANDAATEGYS